MLSNMLILSSSLTHHSKADFIIDGIIKHSTAIFQEYAPVKLETDIEKINKLINTIPNLVIEDIDVKKHREKILQMKDEYDPIHEREEKEIEEIPDVIETELDLIAKINLCFKYGEIIGQILKNYHSSLPARTRYKLGVEAFNLEMRGLSSFVTHIENDMDIFVEYIVERIEYDEKEMDKEAIKGISYQILFNLCFIDLLYFYKKNIVIIRP